MSDWEIRSRAVCVRCMRVHSKTQAMNPSVSQRDKGSCQGAVCTQLAVSPNLSHRDALAVSPPSQILADRPVNQF